jgi:hypothetical protein
MYYGGMRKYSDVMHTGGGRAGGWGGWVGRLGTNSCWFLGRGAYSFATSRRSSSAWTYCV